MVGLSGLTPLVSPMCFNSRAQMGYRTPSIDRIANE